MTTIPAAVKNVVGKKCAFQIKVTPYNINQGCEEYTITRVSELTPVARESDDSSVGNMKKKQKCA